MKAKINLLQFRGKISIIIEPSNKSIFAKEIVRTVARHNDEEFDEHRKAILRSYDEPCVIIKQDFEIK